MRPHWQVAQPFSGRFSTFRNCPTSSSALIIALCLNRMAAIKSVHVLDYLHFSPIFPPPLVSRRAFVHCSLICKRKQTTPDPSTAERVLWGGLNACMSSIAFVNIRWRRRCIQTGHPCSCFCSSAAKTGALISSNVFSSKHLYDSPALLMPLSEPRASARPCERLRIRTKPVTGPSSPSFSMLRLANASSPVNKSAKCQKG